MKAASELVLAANHSYVDSYRKLVTHTRGGASTEFGGVFAFSSGLPLWLFNGCIVVQGAATRDLEAGLAWIRERDVPYLVGIEEESLPGLDDIAIAHGLAREVHPYPGMVLHPIPEPPSPASGVEVVPVSEAGLDEHLRVRVANGLAAPLARRLFSASFAADPDVEFFTARLDGRAVGASIAIRSGDVGGIYAVGTSPEARRRGVGTAATWACVAMVRAWGSDTVALQASEMGLPIYTAMGFQTVVRYAIFRQQAGA
jgi:GNAT superfamily N-acetyltransferase